MEWLQMIVMAIVQGIGEFLPISSSGHLVVLENLFKQLGSNPQFEGTMLNVFLHFGTLIAVLIVFRKRIFLLVSEDRRLIWLLFIATIPAVIVGLTIKKFCGDVLENPLLAGICFPITGLGLLWLSDKSGEKNCKNLTTRDCVWIGLAQAFAILPGISRSGSTILASLCCGLKRKEAATFSFLLSIPVIGGGALLETKDLLDQIQENPVSWADVWILSSGILLSCLVGIIALYWLIRWLEQGKLKYFAYYLFLLGPVVIVWQLYSVFF